MPNNAVVILWFNVLELFLPLVYGVVSGHVLPENGWGGGGARRSKQMIRRGGYRRLRMGRIHGGPGLFQAEVGKRRQVGPQHWRESKAECTSSGAARV